MSRIAHWVWFPLSAIVRFMGRNGRRIAVSVLGLVLLLAGLVMMVLPGPGILAIIAGLAVLATEYVWAERALNLAREKAEQAKNKVLRRRQPPSDQSSAGDPPVADES